MEEKKLKLDWLSIGEAAEYLGVSRDTLRRWEKRGKMKSYRTPGGRRRYTVYDLELALKPPKTVPHLIPKQKPEPPIKEEVEEEKEDVREEKGEKEVEEKKEEVKEEEDKEEEEEKEKDAIDDPLKELLKKREEKPEEVKESKRPYLLKVVSLSFVLLILSSIVFPAAVNLVVKMVSGPGEPINPIIQQELEDTTQEEAP